MKKKKSVTKQVLDEMGLASPKRFHKKKWKPNPYNAPETSLDDFTHVYDALKKLLKKHSKRFDVEEDENSYFLRVPALGDRKSFHLFGISMTSGYVSFAYFPLNDENYDKNFFPAKLRERRHGKASLNFCQIDEAMFAVLDKAIAKVIRLAENSGYFAEERGAKRS